jgi:hypothetical protein
MKKIEDLNLDRFIADSEELATLLNSLPEWELSRAPYSEGFFAYAPDNSVSFDDGENGYEYEAEIEIDVVTQTYRMPDAPDSGQDETVKYRSFTTVREMVDSIRQTWDC